MDCRALMDITAAFGAVINLRESCKVFLNMLYNQIPYDRAIFWIVDPITRMPSGPPVTMNISPEIIKKVMNSIEILNTLMHAYEKNQFVITTFSELYGSDPSIYQSEYYEVVLKPDHICHQMGCYFLDGSVFYGAIGLDRTENKGNFNSDELEILKYLYPHIINRFRWNYAFTPSDSGNKPPDISSISYAEPLTLRENEIIRMILLGKTNKDISKYLGISLNTVKMHLYNSYAKLGVNRRSQLYDLMKGPR